MNNKIVLESLAMDLKRVALGQFRGSMTMAQRFYEEALLRIGELDMQEVKPYMQKILQHVKQLREDADNALLYSTLIQNYTQKFL